jgi:hypothetical protein
LEADSAVTIAEHRFVDFGNTRDRFSVPVQRDRNLMTKLLVDTGGSPAAFEPDPTIRSRKRNIVSE